MEGYIPSGSVDPRERGLVSLETACILNAGANAAEVEITIYFADQEMGRPSASSAAAFVACAYAKWTGWLGVCLAKGRAGG